MPTNDPGNSFANHNYQIITYTVTIGNQVITKKAIVYYDKSGKEVTREKYDETTTIIDEGYKDPTFVDTISFSVNASEDAGYCEEVSNRFLKRGGGSYTNITPFVLLQDSVLIGATLSAREDTEWSGVIFRNEEEIASLDSNGAKTATQNFSIKCSKGDQISLFVRGENVPNPGIEAFFTSVSK